MLLLPQRNPVYTAKEVSSLDWLSGGRVDLGIGVGWLKEEFDVLNVPWDHRGHRTRRTSRCCARSGSTRRPPSTVRPMTCRAARCSPSPSSNPRPVHIGGETKAALRRAARHGQGWHTFNRSPEELAAGLAELDEELEAVGRSRTDLRITVCPYFNQLTPQWVEGYAEAGADAVAALFFAFTPEDVARAFDDLEACRDAAASAGG